jgi:hypothetical protein
VVFFILIAAKPSRWRGRPEVAKVGCRPSSSGERGELGREIHQSVALKDVRFVTDYGLKSDIAGGAKGANIGSARSHQQRRERRLSDVSRMA